MPDIGWVQITDADTYFTTRYGASAWAALINADKTSLLTTAWNRIRSDTRFTIPGTPSADQKLILAMAQEETAWYMYIHLADEDRRIGLIAQGVIEAGIVKEKYRNTGEIPLPPIVVDLLVDFLYAGSPVGGGDIDRSESSSYDTDVASDKIVDGDPYSY